MLEPLRGSRGMFRVWQMDYYDKNADYCKRKSALSASRQYVPESLISKVVSIITEVLNRNVA